MLATLKRLPIGYNSKKILQPSSLMRQETNCQMVLSGKSSCLDQLFCKVIWNNPEKQQKPSNLKVFQPTIRRFGTKTDEGLLLWVGRMDSRSSLMVTIELEDVSNLNKSQHIDSAVAVPQQRSVQNSWPMSS